MRPPATNHSMGGDPHVKVRATQPGSTVVSTARLSCRVDIQGSVGILNAMGGSGQSSVCVVIPTHNRPVEVRRAISAVLAQDYSGPVDVLVVYDRNEPDSDLVSVGDRPVRVMSNSRTPGLAGTRNTGIVASTSEFVAFCDDDDYWAPGKLRQQIDAIGRYPESQLVTCSIVVEYRDKSTPRLAGVDLVTHDMLVRSRMSMLHSSTLVFKREGLVHQIGLVNEEIPGSQNEDWDLLLRTSKLAPIVHVDVPLVHVPWGQSSHFSRRWDSKIASSHWMLDHHHELSSDAAAAARVMGQIAFAHACAGERRKAWRWSREALARRPTQWRAFAAAGVAIWPPSGERLLDLLHRFGRGV